MLFAYRTFTIGLFFIFNFTFKCNEKSLHHITNLFKESCLLSLNKFENIFLIDFDDLNEPSLKKGIHQLISFLLPDQ